MVLNQFWIFVPSDGSGSEGFSLFSITHIIWLVVLFLGIALYTIAYRNSDEKTRDNMRKIMALFLLLYELAKQSVNSFLEIPNGIYLPFEICSLAEYCIMLDALWPGSQLRKQLMAYGFLPAAFMALMMPTVTLYPPISFYTIHQFVMHAGIVAYIVAQYSAGEIQLKYKGIWQSIFVLSILIIPVYYINYITHQNYMYLMHFDGNPVIEMFWNLSGGRGGLLYVLALVLMVAIVMHIMYGIFFALGKIKGDKTVIS